MYKNKKSRKYLNKRMRIKNKTKTMQKRLRKLKRGGNPEGDRPPPRPAPPPFVLNHALVAQVQAEIARLNAVLNNNNVQGAWLFLGVIIQYFTTVLDNYMQSSNNIRGNQMVNLLNQMLAQSQGVIAGINLNAMRLLSAQIGRNVLLANGDNEMYN
jgi:hypothetical protein